ncbi:Xylulose kinase [Carex littledalei]|uniref:Xylulose kinase n=1 Tax=Carex littledalei TaxID=544730 RepID=A0A833QCA2_9POAL|nr:Xylulose kinase [Carex littledalei]
MLSLKQQPPFPSLFFSQKPQIPRYIHIQTPISTTHALPSLNHSYIPTPLFPRNYRNTITLQPAASSSSSASPDSDSDKSKTPDKTIKLALVFVFWYAQNVIFNIYNKKVLNVFPYPWLLASFQLLAGSLWMLSLWSLRLQPMPRLSGRFIAALLGPALFHTIGHISACVSFSRVAVSFTHVIKSAEPVFSVVLSAVILRKFYPVQVWLSIVPIVAGCSLAVLTEPTFDTAGLSGALISNLGFVLRNIYSKQSLSDFSEIDGLNLYGCISILSLLYLFPVAIFVEGSKWAAGFRHALTIAPSPNIFYLWVLISGLFYHLYNQSSYQALDDISPLTFSVGNTMKRVVVIVASIIVFRNPVSPLNALGSAIAILGTFLYSQATASPKKDVDAKA